MAAPLPLRVAAVQRSPIASPTPDKVLEMRNHGLHFPGTLSRQATIGQDNAISRAEQGSIAPGAYSALWLLFQDPCHFNKRLLVNYRIGRCTGKPFGSSKNRSQISLALCGNNPPGAVQPLTCPCSTKRSRSFSSRPAYHGKTLSPMGRSR